MIAEDTIAAISTPYGTGGIGIIRISGDRAFEIAKTIFKGKKNFDEIKSHTINYGKIIDPVKNETIDEVLVTKMKKPNTFTREDVVEINCHGGIVVLKKILDLVLRQGARAAEPGEFTKRAFLNGRIDLSQAEAVIDIINSKTEESSKAAVNQLEGKLSSKIKALRRRLIEILAHIEAVVDYPEEDIEEITGEKVYNEIKDIKENLKKITDNFERGRILREGIDAVIVGRPNVGKSSLLNELTGKNRAIVTDIPGTTRDIIEEYININDIPVRIVDTAGIRETEDAVEIIGVEKTHKALEEAELVIMMVDAEKGFTPEDSAILEKVANKKLIILINKIDKSNEENIKNIEKNLEGMNYIRTSIREEIGIDKIGKMITKLFTKGEINLNSQIILTNIRHKNLIDKAILSIDDAMGAYENKMPLDLMTIDITNAADFLGQITGESVKEDVINEIFSRFCLGK
ncbi:MAG TPA: tRNA uridine-5-carboxymethylaminomethyl(34) synthesis GTPase MnmE [Ruminiclostridium sp.]|jgi:tRNA modification GTPase|uniref:tRNA modification GTPase MnmE n=1 Tax=Acetivibrio saccincola TaxID=1677857 RepID=A0A2K9EM45_9FIRM|nr:tRNA uridine-5-carboxymethylaminomethyl(34) synthesis GTPase MnmE [Acetivibrio saccincola]HAA43492.1 tRNA uridine-5-carboxymethylaminomethyl(34) synthesis GTPase MnmE [Ruminiclostridium sp.]AUG59113.1 tRNA modification GTPase MnmE [Acetivibrio saccincola]NLW27166.1 tRNA uridine-5-carboxymethylaminomethyl(34) synthesis GTPase MnmE [Acetivibrio saccincola]PQQ65824.1 tRNA uridine-5-carboxymethylaminomethyl(34) synthesis GTPase MnmE [Acetivibrio saccincola]HQD28936.1 tRNA uridine-5-carboxymethy